MENQHRKIKGYRELDQEEIDLMNEIKAKGAELKALLDRVSEREETLRDDSADLSEALVYGEALRWVAIAKTHWQQGLMALTRAVAKPDFF